MSRGQGSHRPTGTTPIQGGDRVPSSQERKPAIPRDERTLHVPVHGGAQAVDVEEIPLDQQSTLRSPRHQLNTPGSQAYSSPGTVNEPAIFLQPLTAQSIESGYASFNQRRNRPMNPSLPAIGADENPLNSNERLAIAQSPPTAWNLRGGELPLDDHEQRVTAYSPPAGQYLESSSTPPRADQLPSTTQRPPPAPPSGAGKCMLDLFQWPLTCMHCPPIETGGRFNNIGHLRVHYATTHGRRFHCSGSCQCSFDDAGERSRHRSAAHDRGTARACPVPGCRFVTLQGIFALDEHRMQRHV